MPTVTIGLPFHNARDWLGDAIRSVFAQTFTDWELLLVDDGSTDDSLELARRVRDERVRVISEGVRRRLPARLNQITDLARADLVARVDADDMLHPEKVERQLRVLDARPSINLVSTAMFSLDAGGRLMAIGAEGRRSASPFQVLRKGLLAHATMVARKSWLRANRYDSRYPRAEDRELFARTCRTVCVVQVDEPLYLQCHRKDVARTLDDYVASMRDNRRILRDQGRALAGPFAVLPLVAESLAKEATFRVATALGRQDLLVRRRGRPPTLAERDEASAALRRIRETRVPGLDA